MPMMIMKIKTIITFATDESNDEYNYDEEYDDDDDDTAAAPDDDIARLRGCSAKNKEFWLVAEVMNCIDCTYHHHKSVPSIQDSTQ